MNPDTTIATMQRLLEQALAPVHLLITDDSHLHRGHRPAHAPGGHYTVHIAADCFTRQPLRECHRMVYQALQTLMPQAIHALAIKIVTASDSKPE